MNENSWWQSQVIRRKPMDQSSNWMDERSSKGKLPTAAVMHYQRERFYAHVWSPFSLRYFASFTILSQLSALCADWLRGSRRHFCFKGATLVRLLFFKDRNNTEKTNKRNKRGIVQQMEKKQLTVVAESKRRAPGWMSGTWIVLRFPNRLDCIRGYA